MFSKALFKWGSLVLLCWIILNNSNAWGQSIGKDEGNNRSESCVNPGFHGGRTFTNANIWVQLRSGDANSTFGNQFVNKFKNGLKKWNESTCRNGNSQTPAFPEFTDVPTNEGPSIPVPVIYFKGFRKPRPTALNIPENTKSCGYFDPATETIYIFSKARHEGIPKNCDIASVVAHELGHYLGMGHTEDHPGPYPSGCDDNIMSGDGFIGNQPLTRRVKTEECELVSELTVMPEECQTSGCPRGCDCYDPPGGGYEGEFEDVLDVSDGPSDCFWDFVPCGSSTPWYWTPGGDGLTEVVDGDVGCPDGFVHENCDNATQVDSGQTLVYFPSGDVMEGPVVGTFGAWPETADDTLTINGFSYSPIPLMGYLFFIDDVRVHPELTVFSNGSFEAHVDLSGFSNGSHQMKLMVIDDRHGPNFATKITRNFIKNNTALTPPDISIVKSWNSERILIGEIHDYGEYALDAMPQSRLMLVCNVGGEDLLIGQPQVTGSAFYSIGESPRTTIEGNTCSDYRIRFDASQPGSYQGQVTFLSNDPDEADFTYGLAGTAVANGDNNAAITISHNLPDQVTCQQNFELNITIRNIGDTVWQERTGILDSHRLGAIDDSDPFSVDGRIRLPIGVQIHPDDTYTFSKTLTAPSSPGVYRSDWRMVHEGVEWFGPSIVKDVLVSCGNSPFNITIEASADAHVAQTWPNANYGDTQELRVRTAAQFVGRFTFLMFNIPDSVNLNRVLSATLKLRTQETHIPHAGFYTVDIPAWQESFITWNNWGDQSSATIISEKTNLSAHQWYWVDVSPAVVNSHNLTIGVVSNHDLPNMDFWSQESAFAPQLIIEIQP